MKSEIKEYLQRLSSGERPDKTYINHLLKKLDEEQDTLDERKFTFQEILTYGAVCAVKGRDMIPVQYFKEKFDIDITE